MKINLGYISLFFIITTAMVKAQRYTKFNKPIIDLNNKPQVTTPKLPEERRKLSIFPKSLVKYVVTSKPYAKVRTYSPYQVTTKRPVMQQLLPKENKNVRTMAATRAPIMKYHPATTTYSTPKRQFTPRFQFTTKTPVAQIPKDTNFYESEEDKYMEAPSTRHNVAYNSENNLSSFDEKDYDSPSSGENADKELSTFSFTNKTAATSTENINESIDLDAVESIDSSLVNVNITLKVNKEEGKKTVKEELVNKEMENKKEEDTKEEHKKESEITETESKEIHNAETNNPDVDTVVPEYVETESQELENNRKKRLSVLGRSVYNNIEVSENKPDKENMLSKKDSDTASEKNDRNEFIFIKDYLKAPVEIKKSNFIAAEIEESVEIATEIAWLEEYNSRPERSVNVIEEENLETTVSGFKFTDRELRVDSNLVFRNINA